MVLPSTLNCEYVLPVVGNQSVTALQKRMANVRIPLSILREWGLIPYTDHTTVIGQTVHRVLQFDMGRGSAPATCALPAGGGESLSSITLSGGESGWFNAAPIPQFTPAAGAPGSGASAVCGMGVATAIIARGGAGYTGAATAAVVGGDLAPGGTPATLGALTIVGGAVVGVNINTTGDGYTTYPDIVVTDPAATQQAEVYGGLQVNEMTLVNPGDFYTAAPVISVLPLFFSMALGNISAMPAVVKQFMLGVFQNALGAQVQEVPPFTS